MESAWVCGNASGCFGNSVLGCANHGCRLAKRILGYNRRIKKLQNLVVDPEIDLWTNDRVHFQQHGSRCRIWVPPEIKDPLLLHHPTRRSVAYFGEVRLWEGCFVFRREPERFNGETFFQFLQHLRQVGVRARRWIVVITDNAKCHHATLHRAWREQHADRFALHFLPPYSPGLNPIERVWKLTRRLCLHKRYFPTLEEVLPVVELSFAEWTGGNETLRRLSAVT